MMATLLKKTAWKLNELKEKCFSLNSLLLYGSLGLGFKSEFERLKMAREVRGSASRIPILSIMKHLSFRFLLLTALILSGLPAFSEQRGGGSIGVNLFGGFGSTHHEQNGVGLVESQMGLTYGLGLEFIVLPDVSVEIDLLNTQKNFEAFPSGGTEKESYFVNYLETPVLIKWRASKNFHLKTGPFLSSLMIKAEKESGGVSEPVKDRFKNDYGVTFGAWFGFQTKKSLWIGLDVRYDMGLADIWKDNTAGTQLYSRTVMGLLNFTFLFK